MAIDATMLIQTETRGHLYTVYNGQGQVGTKVGDSFLKLPGLEGIILPAAYRVALDLDTDMVQAAQV